MLQRLLGLDCCRSRLFPTYCHDRQPASARPPARRAGRRRSRVSLLINLAAAQPEAPLTWNGENRLVAAEASSSRLEFVYDYMGRRTERKTYAGTIDNWTLSETRRFIYDGWNLIAEFVVGGEMVTLDRTHLWGLDLSRSLHGMGGVGGLLRTTERGTGSNPYYPTYDANGNVSEYVGASGLLVAHYEYSPFGGNASLTGAMATHFQFQFSTKYLDSAIALYYYGHRYYSFHSGRWLSRDPIGVEGGSNLFAFVLNDPVQGTDRLGLRRCCNSSAPIKYCCEGWVHGYEIRGDESPTDCIQDALSGVWWYDILGAFLLSGATITADSFIQWLEVDPGLPYISLAGLTAMTVSFRYALQNCMRMYCDSWYLPNCKCTSPGLIWDTWSCKCGNRDIMLDDISETFEGLNPLTGDIRYPLGESEEEDIWRRRN